MRVVKLKTRNPNAHGEVKITAMRMNAGEAIERFKDLKNVYPGQGATFVSLMVSDRQHRQKLDKWGSFVHVSGEGLDA